MKRREIASGGQTEPSARELQEPAFSTVENETKQGMRGGQGDGENAHAYPVRKEKWGT